MVQSLSPVLSIPIVMSLRAQWLITAGARARCIGRFGQNVLIARPNHFLEVAQTAADVGRGLYVSTETGIDRRSRQASSMRSYLRSALNPIVMPPPQPGSKLHRIHHHLPET